MSGEHIRAIPSVGSFTRKQIAVTFNIVRPDGGTDSLTLESDYRIKAIVSHAGMSVGSELDIEIYGMSLNDMNRLSYVANYPNAQNPRTVNQSNSTVIVRVGDYGRPLTTLFMGLLTEGYADLNGGEPVFRAHAMTSVLLAGILPDPISYRGPRSVVSILSDICTASGYQLIDHGGWDRHATLTNTYLEGTTLQMIEKVIKACGGTYNSQPISARNDKDGSASIGLVEVWGPTYGGVTKSALEDTIPLISVETGLIGYPTYNRAGISFTTLLRPDIAYYQPIKMKNRYTPAGWVTGTNGLNQQGQSVGRGPWDGIWLPISITHEVTAEIPGGNWHTFVDCQRTNIGEKIAVK
ncbi:hypothetical protein NQF87_08430 [Bombella sp. TMW 2.2559]|uniref:Uncharacterized protein n=1 Tax=Bombella dulcis TaxID=2967339 RepID=A0ABT3WD35_9PROT|nr:hypothetical protein [Bombella dulcis]MCX5616992.1 hypothetical protein [Bombella dulcis]